MLEMKLSVLMAVYNERATLQEILDRVFAASLPAETELEIVAVDDCSSDGSWKILSGYAGNEPRLRIFRHDKNQGKGAAIRTAVDKASGDVAIIQDADLEYNPGEYGRLLSPILNNDADVVYGSRFVTADHRRVLFFWHSVANRLLTTFSNMMTDLNLTDMETCYKAFRMNVLKTMPIRSNRFGIEPELTAKIAKRRLKIFEVSISYDGRTYVEGKKIGLKDAFQAFWTIIKYRIVDDLYNEDCREGSLRAMELASGYSAWFMEKISPELEGAVLETGSGVGANTRTMTGLDLVIATDPLEENVRLLRNAFAGRKNVRVEKWDVTEPAPETIGKVDTVLCSNTLEQIDDHAAALNNISNVLEDNGKLVLSVPAGKDRFCAMDEDLGRYRRYDQDEVTGILEDSGFTVEKTFDMNRFGALAWAWNGNLLCCKKLARWQLKLFNMLVPLMRLVDGVLPWKGLSLVMMCRKNSAREKQAISTEKENRTEREMS